MVQTRFNIPDIKLGKVAELKVLPCIDNDGNVDRPEPGEAPEFWSVYAVHEPSAYNDGFCGSSCIADCETEEEANTLADLFRWMVNAYVGDDVPASIKALTVFVEVAGGTVHSVSSTGHVEVVVIDHDNLLHDPENNLDHIVQVEQATLIGSGNKFSDTIKSDTAKGFYLTSELERLGY